jgi:glutathione S-transferase
VTEPASAKLYVILGSHACRAGMLMLDHKGIPYRAVTLPTGLHPMLLRLRGFPSNPVHRRIGDRRPLMLAMADRFGTVPALNYGGERVQTNRDIACFLDRLQPDPPLFGADPERRPAIEEAERWGDEVFQMAARRLAFAALLHGRDGMIDRGNDGRLGPLLFRHETVRFVGAGMLGRMAFGASRATEPELLGSLTGMLDRVDGWIGAGVLNGEDLNAADFIIAPSLALISYRRDLRAQVEARAAAELVERVLPEPVNPPRRSPPPRLGRRRGAPPPRSPSGRDVPPRPKARGLAPRSR